MSRLFVDFSAILLTLTVKGIQTMSRIALIGPGAIGGLVAAWLCQDKDHEVTVCARTHIRHLNLNTPYGTFEARPRVLTEPAAVFSPDWVLVTTKAYDSESATAWFPSLLCDDTQVAIIQNGVDHVERFSAHLCAVGLCVR